MMGHEDRRNKIFSHFNFIGKGKAFHALLFYITFRLFSGQPLAQRQLCGLARRDLDVHGADGGWSQVPGPDAAADKLQPGNAPLHLQVRQHGVRLRGSRPSRHSGSCLLHHHKSIQDYFFIL